MRLTSYLIALDLAVVVGMILIAALTDRPLKAGFAEYQPVTLLSTLQLAVISFVLFRVWHRIRSLASDHVRSAATVWLLLSAGFMFLAADELLQIHERLDFAIHDILGITETNLTDHIDEAILVAYFGAGIAVLFRFRGEFLGQDGLGIALAGIGFFAMSIALDATLNGSTIGDGLGVPLSILEESFELVAEAFFLGYAALRLGMARDSDASTGQDIAVTPEDSQAGLAVSASQIDS